jgi:hypothetical protein
MIIGKCPYCDEIMFNPIPKNSQLPAFGQVNCEDCGETAWLKYSRLTPEAYSIAAFEKEFDIDRETKTITRKKRRNR